MSSSSSETDWARWVEAQKRIVTAMSALDTDTVAAELEPFLQRDTPQEIRWDALGYRAFLKQEAGDFDGARLVLLESRELAAPGSYKRYVDEASLSDVSLKSGLAEEAANWHLSALKTALASNDIIAAYEVKKLLELRSDTGLSDQEHTLCVAVVEKNWKALFGDEPVDLSDMMPALTKIIGKAFA